jgi:parallel beta-helix repeat protein
MKRLIYVLLVVILSIQVNALCIGSTANFTCGVAGLNQVNQSCIMDSDETVNLTCWVVNTNNVVLDCNGHTITGNLANYGVYFANKNNITIKNCIMDNVSRGIYADIVTNILLINNSVSNYYEHGFWLRYFNNSQIISNYIQNATRSNRYGIYMEQSSNNLLMHNYIFNSNMGYWNYQNSNNNYYYNNTADNDGPYIGSSLGFSSLYSNNLTYYSNLAKNFTMDTGFWLTTTTYVNYTNNTAINNYYGFFLSYMNNSYIVSNYIHNNGRGLYVDNYPFYNNFDSNIIDSNTNGFELIKGGYNVISNNIIKNTTNVGTGMLTNETINNLFINNSNEFDYNGTAIKFTSIASQNISSAFNIGWWPLLGSDGTDVNLQNETAWYGGEPGGRDADGSINLLLHYWYNNNGFLNVSIDSPQNTTYSYNLIDFNYTISGSPISCWYSLNNGSNITLASCLNASIIASSGYNELIIYVNDSFGQVVSDSVGFTFNEPPTPPQPGCGGQVTILCPSDELGICSIINSAGAGMALFICYMSGSLPKLLILLILVGIIAVIGSAIAIVIRNSIKGEME